MVIDFELTLHLLIKPVAKCQELHDGLGFFLSQMNHRLKTFFICYPHSKVITTPENSVKIKLLMTWVRCFLCMKKVRRYLNCLST